MLLGTSPRGRMRISELSAATLLSVSGMSRMVDRLVREGLVVRESCEEDGRGAEVVAHRPAAGRACGPRAPATWPACAASSSRASPTTSSRRWRGFWARVEPAGRGDGD